MKNHILIEIKKSLEDTKKTGEIENVLIKDIYRLDSRLVVITDEWIEVGNHDGFYYYQGAFNIQLIIMKIKELFKNTSQYDENKKLAENILSLLPNIDKILTIVQRFKINKKSTDDVLNKTGLLREMAEKVKLMDPYRQGHK